MMAVAAAGLSVVTVDLDDRMGHEWVEAAEWLHGSRPEGARLLLSTIAGSMLGVAGVTFSVTIAAVAYASNQFGPRIITNFMRDRVNQFTLGTFVATFLFCLLVLRKVQPGEDLSAVPHLSLLVAIGFAIASIGVLIEFIHHIADSIHANSAMAAVGRELNQALEEEYPLQEAGSPSGAVQPDERLLPAAFTNEALPVPATVDGFVQAVSREELLEVASSRGLVVQVVRPPGDFAAVGRAVAYVWPPAKVDREAIAAVQRCFAFGRRRTPHQDPRLPLDQLVDMAGRALSPSVNDPMTAIGCLNWLGSALSSLARRRQPPRELADEEGVIRVVLSPLGFADYAEAIFGSLRPYFACDRNACFAMMRVLGEIMVDAQRPEQRTVLFAHACRLAEDAGGRLAVADDRAELDRMLRDLRRLANREGGRPPPAELADWMHGEL